MIFHKGNADMDSLDHVQKVGLEDEGLAGMVEDSGRLVELLKVGEVFGDVLDGLEEVVLMMGKGREGVCGEGLTLSWTRRWHPCLTMRLFSSTLHHSWYMCARVWSSSVMRVERRSQVLRWAVREARWAWKCASWLWVADLSISVDQS